MIVAADNGKLRMILEDSRGREFGSNPDAYEFMPPDLMGFDRGTGITTRA